MVSKDIIALQRVSGGVIAILKVGALTASSAAAGAVSGSTPLAANAHAT